MSFAASSRRLLARRDADAGRLFALTICSLAQELSRHATIQRECQCFSTPAAKPFVFRGHIARRAIQAAKASDDDETHLHAAAPSSRRRRKIPAPIDARRKSQMGGKVKPCRSKEEEPQRFCP